jgi:hypothetical protein
VSLGSFSEAQAVVDPRLLERVFAELSEEISRRENVVSERAKKWLIQDSTLWEALPRMRWALWRRQGTSQSAVRLHLSLHVVEKACSQDVLAQGLPRSPRNNPPVQRMDSVADGNGAIEP